MITNLKIRGFRGIADEVQLQCAQITLLSGRNGLGKTTVFDAIDWCVFGRASRLSKNAESIRNLYRPDIEPYVELVLQTGSRRTTLVRSLTGISVDGSESDDRSVVNSFIIDRSVFPPYAQDVEGRVRSLHYLEQADIRSMVVAGDDTERIALYQGLLGVPHAVIVGSAMRRIRERLETKLTNAETRLGEIRAELASLHDSGVLKSRFAIDLSPLVHATRDALSLDLPDAPQADVLATLLDAELMRLRSRLEELRSVQTKVSAATDERQQLLGERARREELLREAEAHVATANDVARTARESKVRLDEQLADARRVEDATRREVISLESVLDMFRRKAECDIALDAATNSARLATSALSAVATELENATKNIAGLLARQEHARETLGAAERAEARQQREQVLTLEQEHLLTEIERVQRARTDVVTARNAAEQAIRVARQTIFDAEREYETARGAAAAAEVLDALIIDLADHVQRMDVSQCPLCGAAYSTPADLLRRIEQSRSARTAASERIAAALRALQTTEATVDQHRQQLDSRSAQLRQLDAELARLQSRLTEVRTELETCSVLAASEETPPISVVDARSALFSIEEAIRGSQTAKQQLEEKHRRALSSKQEAESIVQRQQRERQELTTELQARAASSSIAEIETRAALRQRALLQAQGAREAIEAEIVLAADRLRQAEESLISARSQADAAQSATSRVRGRLQMNETDINLELERVVGHGANEEILASELRQLRDQEIRIADLSAKAREAVAVAEQDDKYRRAQALITLRHEVELDHEKIRRALQRLKEVTASISERAAREEASAAEHYRAAIQECFRALLPHRHLNELSVDGTSGEIYASDRFLDRQDSRRVRPASYFSTGQANALALSIFLGTALRQRVTRFDFLMLDEPVQNMDDVHFLAFMTLAKRMALSNQVILSTADANVAELFRRQMASSWRIDRGSFVEYEWLNFSATIGPEIKIHSNEPTSKLRQG